MTIQNLKIWSRCCLTSIVNSSKWIIAWKLTFYNAWQAGRLYLVKNYFGVHVTKYRRPRTQTQLVNPLIVGTPCGDCRPRPHAGRRLRTHLPTPLTTQEFLINLISWLTTLWARQIAPVGRNDVGQYLTATDDVPIVCGQWRQHLVSGDASQIGECLLFRWSGSSYRVLHQFVSPLALCLCPSAAARPVTWRWSMTENCTLGEKCVAATATRSLVRYGHEGGRREGRSEKKGGRGREGKGIGRER